MPATKTDILADGVTAEEFNRVVAQRDELRRAMEELLYSIHYWRQGGITAEGCRQAEDAARAALAKCEE